MVPFCPDFFLTFTATSILFAVESTLINTYYDSMAWALFSVPMWWTLMFMVAYFMRRGLTQFFVMQTEAEKTRDLLTQILGNLPDAVIMLEADSLSYCN
jgi:hypothetical protein